MDRLTAAANCLKEGGAYKIYAVATHGLLSKDACEQLDNSALDEVINMILLITVSTFMLISMS